MFIQYYNQEPSWYEKIPWVYILIGIIILILLLKRNKKSYHSHWNTLIPDFTYSSKDFYAQLKKELLSHNIQGVKTSFANHKEGGTISSRRTYLRVSWKEFEYDLCCAPFGDGIFLSWWLVYKTSLGERILFRVPFIGNWLVSTFYPTTYYSIDTASMFMTYCHQSVLKVSDDITKDKGKRIADTDRKPILKDIFKR